MCMSAPAGMCRYSNADVMRRKLLTAIYMDLSIDNDRCTPQGQLSLSLADAPDEQPEEQPEEGEEVAARSSRGAGRLRMLPGCGQAPAVWVPRVDAPLDGRPRQARPRPRTSRLGLCMQAAATPQQPCISWQSLSLCFLLYT